MSSDLLRVTDAGERIGDMIYRVLGRTGEKVSLFGLGGAHLSADSLDERGAIKLIHAALDGGINFLDNSWDYSNGRSEKRMGTALAQLAGLLAKTKPYADGTYELFKTSAVFDATARHPDWLGEDAPGVKKLAPS